jgi:hypothetical protein
MGAFKMNRFPRLPAIIICLLLATSAVSGQVLPNGASLAPQTGVSTTGNLWSAIYGITNYLGNSGLGPNVLTVAALGAQYTSIQAAVNAAVAAGASAAKPYVVMVGPGSYNEQVTLAPGITLYGSNRNTCKITHDNSPNTYTGTVVMDSNTALNGINVVGTKADPVLLDACEAATNWATSLTNITTSADAAVYLVGTHSIKSIAASGFTSGTVARYSNATPWNYTHILVRLKPSKAYVAWHLSLVMSTAMDGSGSTYTLRLPKLSAGVWYALFLPTGGSGTRCTNIKSASLTSSDAGAQTINLDDLRYYDLGSAPGQADINAVCFKTGAVDSTLISNCLLSGDDDVIYCADGTLTNCTVDGCNLTGRGDGIAYATNMLIQNCNYVWQYDPYRNRGYANGVYDTVGGSATDQFTMRNCSITSSVPAGTWIPEGQFGVSTAALNAVMENVMVNLVNAEVDNVVGLAGFFANGSTMRLTNCRVYMSDTVSLTTPLAISGEPLSGETITGTNVAIPGDPSTSVIMEAPSKVEVIREDTCVRSVVSGS